LRTDLEQNCSKPGCDVELRRDCIAAHELNCGFRMVPCPVASCQKNFLFKNIDMHIREEHKESVILNRPELVAYLKEVSLNGRDDNWVLFSYQKTHVQFYFVFVKRNDHWYSWVSINGGPEDASAWVFTVKAKNNEKKMAVEFSGGYVHPIDSSVEEVIKTGQYLLLNRSNVEQLLTETKDAARKQEGNTSLISIMFTINQA